MTDREYAGRCCIRSPGTDLLLRGRENIGVNNGLLPHAIIASSCVGREEVRLAFAFITSGAASCFASPFLLAAAFDEENYDATSNGSDEDDYANGNAGCGTTR